MKLRKLNNIRAFFQHKYSTNDLRELFPWLNSNKGIQELEDELDDSWDNFSAPQNLKIDSTKIFREIEKEIRQQPSKRPMQRLQRLLPYASVLLLLAALRIVFTADNKHANNPAELYSLNTTVITEAGQRSKVILPDSSVVWLNSGTTLSYHEDAQKNERKVQLTGEAFFQVHHNENKPFLVQNQQLIVQVLGTQFNVEAYPETGKINVALQSGSVQLKQKENESFQYQLNPGEIAAFDVAQNEMQITEADVDRISAWKHGTLIFHNDPMKLVIEKLERWYDINVEVQDDAVYHSMFTGTITNEGYEQIFRLIEFTCPVKCTIVNKLQSDKKPKIIITKKV